MYSYLPVIYLSSRIPRIDNSLWAQDYFSERLLISEFGSRFARRLVNSTISFFRVRIYVRMTLRDKYSLYPPLDNSIDRPMSTVLIGREEEGFNIRLGRCRVPPRVCRCKKQKKKKKRNATTRSLPRWFRYLDYFMIAAVSRVIMYSPSREIHAFLSCKRLRRIDTCARVLARCKCLQLISPVLAHRKLQLDILRDTGESMYLS